MKKLNVIGLNSGTSMDGVDVALFEISPLEQDDPKDQLGQNDEENADRVPAIPRLRQEMLASMVYPFEPDFQHGLKNFIAVGQASLEDISRVNVALGEVFASSAHALINSAGMSMVDADLIGSHGQTIWHTPAERPFWGVRCRASLQLGEPAVIAERTGLPVVADFRAADLAAGGQGAPLVPFADQVLFGAQRTPTGVLNIGGIANITALSARGEAISAFDTGPGNMIIDRAADQLFHCEYDRGGDFAAGGTIDREWLSALLTHPYFNARPPKTTGREDFGYSFADGLIREGRERGLSPHDCIATLTALTAGAIVQSYRDFIEPEVKLARIVLGGGGADNKFLSRLIRDFWPHPVDVLRHEDFGISTKFKESLLFALLAYTTYFGIPNNVPKCTGASHKVCLGKLCNPF